MPAAPAVAERWQTGRTRRSCGPWRQGRATAPGTCWPGGNHHWRSLWSGPWPGPGARPPPRSHGPLPILLLAKLAFDAGDALQLLLDGVEGPLQAGKPARQQGTLVFQPRAELVNATLGLRVRCWRCGGGADETATGRGHGQVPSTIWSLTLPSWSVCSDT